MILCTCAVSSCRLGSRDMPPRHQNRRGGMGPPTSLAPLLSPSTSLFISSHSLSLSFLPLSFRSSSIKASPPAASPNRSSHYPLGPLLFGMFVIMDSPKRPEGRTGSPSSEERGRFLLGGGLAEGVQSIASCSDGDSLMKVV